MEARASLRHARIAPRKVQIVLDLIRNKPADQAWRFSGRPPRPLASPLEKLLKSAVANAENNFNMDRNNLYVSRVLRHPRPDDETDPPPRARAGRSAYSRGRPTSSSPSKNKNNAERGGKLWAKK